MSRELNDLDLASMPYTDLQLQQRSANFLKQLFKRLSQ